jgi:putative membrane protein insertion efficiency factor
MRAVVDGDESAAADRLRGEPAAQPRGRSQPDPAQTPSGISSGARACPSRHSDGRDRKEAGVGHGVCDPRRRASGRVRRDGGVAGRDAPVSRLTGIAVGAIRGYQYVLSPWVGSACRFAPTCSEYARLAIIDHGVARGSWLALRRLLRCQPFHRGGYDPPPPVRSV